MKIITIPILCLFIIFTGCDVKNPPKDVNPDTIYDQLPTYNQDNVYPADATFDTLLNQSIYEDPQGTITTDFTNFATPAFFLDSNLHLVFMVNKKKDTNNINSQLIQTQTWKTSDSEGNYFISSVRCYKPKTINSYTFAQIHGLKNKDGNQSIYYNYPLVKLFWERNFKNQYDHIWAMIVKSTPSEFEPKIYEYVDLGERPDYIFPAEIHIKNNILEVKIHHSVKSTQNVSYWENVINYFQAGILLEIYGESGEVGVSFEQLNFEDNASHVDDITHF